MATQIKSRRTIDVASVLPSIAYSDAENAIEAIPGLTAWFEATHGVHRRNGFRWRARNRNIWAQVHNLIPPPVRTAANGHPAIYTGYGAYSLADPTHAEIYATTERGGLRTDRAVKLLGATAFTTFSVVRVPKNNGSEPGIPSGGTVGGVAWGAVGPASNNTPKLTLSSSTGRANFAAAGVLISNPVPALDLRDSAIHLHRCAYDGSAGTIALNTDRGRSVGTQTGAAASLDLAYDGIQSPTIACLFNSVTGALSLPLYGQTQVFIVFSAILTADQIALVENYIAAKYSITLI
ncbi:hypothetical protein [Labrys wisconsinensis]|uniref:Uncharacterized protein n=1 Tax=Labrys wisconsinensis TaxID=425677 RepID=A0ABU0JL55_9HYPH|nr:hypothetical protein [Labrys wisconsinensis]MDQ0475014.1 hypothetical protein [Labrys wisconsinensis]